MLLAVGTAFPRVAEALIGRDATWRAVAYEWPAPVVFVGTALLAAAAAVLSRAWQWSAARRETQHLAPSVAPASRSGGTPESREGDPEGDTRGCAVRSGRRLTPTTVVGRA